MNGEFKWTMKSKSKRKNCH